MQLSRSLPSPVAPRQLAPFGTWLDRTVIAARPYLPALALALLVTAVVVPHAMAGTSGTEFAAVWTTLTGWMQGTLGKIISGALVLVGLVAGVARQSLIAFAVGVGGGIGIYNSPTIINNIVTGTLPDHLSTADALRALLG